MQPTTRKTRRKFEARMGPTQAADVEFYCRACKGHFSRAISLDAFWNTACRCGSRDLLIYNVSGEGSAPLRA